MKSGKVRDRFRLLPIAAASLGAIASAAWPADADMVERKNVFTLEAGAYNLSKRNQDLHTVGDKVCILFCIFSGHALIPLSNEFDASSRDVAAIGYERRFGRGFSYGADVFHIRNAFVTPGLIPSEGDMKAEFYLATLKKYFGDPHGLRPFIAGGVGLVKARLGGSVNRNASGNAAQAAAGVRYESGRMSVVAEYRYVRAPSINLDTSGETGDVQGKMNLSGQGYFLGLGIKF